MTDADQSYQPERAVEVQAALERYLSGLAAPAAHAAGKALQGPGLVVRDPNFY